MPRQIHVTEQFQGRETGERPILVGIYDADDPRLFGLAEYLVNEQRKAVWLGDAPEPEEAPEPVVIDEPLEDDIADDFEDDGEEPEQDEPFYSALDELMDQFGTVNAEMLRGAVEERGLLDRVVPTGKTGNAVKDDFAKVLAETPAE